VIIWNDKMSKDDYDECRIHFI